MVNNVDDVDDYSVPPPSYDFDGDGGYVPGNIDIAWKQKLIEIRHRLGKTNLDEFMVNEILSFIDNILTSAGMTNITQGQINMFLRKWDKKVHKMKIFFPGVKKNPEFYNAMENIRLELEMQLNKSRDGWQGDHAYETHTRTRYEVRQRQEQVNRERNWKSKFKPRQEVDVE